MNFTFFRSPLDFQDFATRLFLQESSTPGSELRGYTVVSAEIQGDLGVDGYCPDGTIFQMYYCLPVASSPIVMREKAKIADTLSKLARNSQAIEQLVGRPAAKVIFILNRDPDVDLHRYAGERSAACSISVELWGASRLSNLLARHRNVVRDLLPVEWLGSADVARLCHEAISCADAGDWEHAKRLCGRALEEADLLNDAELKFEASVCLAIVVFNEGNDAAALEQAMSRVQRSAERQPDNAEIVLKESLVTSQWLLRTGRIDEAEARIRRALELAERSGEPEALRAPAYLMAWVGISRRDAALLSRFLDMLRDNGGAEKQVAELTAHLALLEGDRESAVEAYRRVLARNVEEGAVPAEYSTRLDLARLLAECNRYEEALDVCRAGRLMAEGDLRAMELALLEGKLHLASGDTARALCQLKQVQDRAAHLGERHIEGEAALARGNVLLQRDALDDAIVTVSAARDAFAACGATVGCVEAIRLLGVASDRQGSPKALDYLNVALKMAEDASGPKEQQAAIRVQMGHILSRRGQFDDALAVLPTADHLKQAPREMVRQAEEVRSRASQAAQIRSQLLEIVRTDHPLTVAKTDSAATLQHAHRTVLLPLFEWIDAWPTHAAGIIDFWGRGNFARLALNHRAFEDSFHLTVEVSSLNDARRAIRILSPICDCLTVLWKGPLVPTFGMVPVHEQYGEAEEAGGWGYAICAGDRYSRDDLAGMWHPAIGLGNYLPPEVVAFLVTEIRPLVLAGRVILLPAPLVGCISQDHGPLESMFSALMHGDPILTQAREPPVKEQFAMVIPYFENAPFGDLATIIEDENASLHALRVTLLEWSALHVRDGKDISPTARRLITEKIRHGIADLKGRLRKIGSTLPPESFAVGGVPLATAVVPSVQCIAATEDDAARALLTLTAEPELRRGPWYAMWCMQERFCTSWKLAGPILPTAGLPGGVAGSGIAQPADLPATGAGLPSMQSEERHLYHWIHPAKGGWTMPTGYFGPT